jgi:hypothetical protein
LWAILGFSARLTGGGATLLEASRLNSPDLRGGGGDGGREEDREGVFICSKRGVWGLLGILKCLGEDDPEVEESGASADR